ncbi:hypothetical protein D5W64_12545 [Salmonella enterica subsp. enterica serovar Saintpaul]|nr:hypothetical protein [Salmonella enterica subsp. enterica serovar Saintpaul]
MKNKLTDWFEYDKYWRQWSRVLLRGGGNFDHEISIPLNPINDSPNFVSEKDWADIAKVQIRKHDIRFRADTKSIYYTHELPQEVYDRLVMMCGKATADVIMHGDLLPMINWKRHEEFGDTYVPFELCRIERGWFFNHTINKDGKATVSMMDAELFKTVMAISVPNDSILAGGIYHEINDTSVRVVSMIDLARDIVTVEFMISNENMDTSTRFTNSIRSDWNPAIYEYLVNSDFIELETNTAILEMIAKIRNNLVFYS